MSDPEKAMDASTQTQEGQQNLSHSAEVHRNLLTILYGKMCIEILEIITPEELMESPELAESLKLYMYSFRIDKTKWMKQKECLMVNALYKATNMYKSEKDKVQKMEKEIDELKKKLQDLSTNIDESHDELDRKEGNKRPRI